MKNTMDHRRPESQSLEIRFCESSQESGGQIEIEFLKPLPLNRPCPGRGRHWLSRLLDHIRPAEHTCPPGRPSQLDLDMRQGKEDRLTD